MGNQFLIMKFTSLAVAALFLANSSAVLLQKKSKDDCDGKWCNKGLAYDLDVPTLNKADADKAKTDAAGAFAGADYKDRATFKAAEAANGAAVHAKEAALDASLKAADDQVAKTLIAARANRDLAASTAAKAASDANLKSNQERVAYEKDQLVKGEDQDRLKFVNENTAAKTSEIQGKHDERERANGRLLKALAS